jgi:hypothetical protein
MPSLYPEKSVTWEAWIYNAFEEAGIDIGTWFVDMANDRKAIYGTSAGGWFQPQKMKKKIIGWNWIRKRWPISGKNLNMTVSTSCGVLVN